MMKQSVKYNQEAFFSDKLCLKKIASLVFELTVCKQMDERQTNILKASRMLFGSRK
jgi:hypothetical protein